MLWILLVLSSAIGGESGGSASLLGRTPKARATRLFMELTPGFNSHKNRNCVQSKDSQYSPSMTVKPFTSFFSSAILALFLLGGITSIQADHHEKLLRHVVSFKYKEGTTQEQIAKVEKAFAALKETIKEIKSFEKGTNNSPEGLNKGFKHCYLLTFHSEKDRGVYLIHPDHVKFGKSLGPVLEDVFVIDYWAQH